MVKRWIALLMNIALVLCLVTACREDTAKGKQETEKSTNNASDYTNELAKEAYVLIEDGDYEEAYMLLKNADMTMENKEAIQLRNRLVFVPTEVKSGNSLLITAQYDENGNLLKSTNEYSTTAYTYDEFGNLLTQTTILNGETNTTAYTYTYGENGKPTSAIVNENIKLSYSYDANNRLLSMICKAEQLDRSEEVLYTYHEGGQRKSYRCTCYEGEQIYSDEYYTYDELGNVLSEKITEGDGYYQETVYSYDENSNLLSEKYTDSDGEGYKYAYTYDSHGNVLTRKDIPAEGGTIETDTYTYIYDEKGNAVTQTYTTYYQDQQVTNYTYDKDGNLRLMQSDWGYSVSYDIFGNQVNLVSDGESYILSWELYYYPNGIPEEIEHLIESVYNTVI